MATLASDYFKAGDVIYEEEPFVKVLRHDLWDQVCAGCFKKNPDRHTVLKKCSGCGVMRFCGKICQKRAWPYHKLECPFLRNYTDYRHQPFVQMMGNIILKLKGKDWKSVIGHILDKEISFDDLVSHANDTSDQSFTVDSQGIVEPLASYIGQENMPNKATLRELFGKVGTNRFGFFCENSKSKSAEGWALFIGGSKLDHSCVPNAIFKVTGSSLTVRAIKTIQKSEKVTISYGNMIVRKDASLTHNALKWSFRMRCHCTDCSQPFGQSDLTKILDMTEASDVLEETDSILLLMSLLVRLKCPTDVVSRDRLKAVSQKQVGVLGRTHLFRMQLLYLLHYCTEGPTEERKRGLLELIDAMREVWGEYWDEMNPIYKKLMQLSSEWKEKSIYLRKIGEIESVCYGLNYDEKTVDLVDMMMTTMPVWENWIPE